MIGVPTVPGVTKLAGSIVKSTIAQLGAHQGLVNEATDLSLELDGPRQLRKVGRLLRGTTFDKELHARVAGKRVLVTGASSGLGRGTSEALIRAGAHVIAVARRQDLLDELADYAVDRPGDVTPIACDLADRDQVVALMDRLLDDGGKVDIVVNNAGRSIRRGLADSTGRLHDFDRVLALNFFSPVWVTAPAVARMRETGGGHIVNISTIATQLKGTPKFAAYASSKAALDQFLGASAPETFADGVLWTTVHMPLTQTDMIAPAQQAWAGNPTLSMAAGVSLILDAIVRRPARVSTPYGSALGLADLVAPETMTRIKAAQMRARPRLAPSVIVIGAGMSGIAMGLELLERGITDFRILEKADDIGGTWRENRYPGVACDVPVYYYSYRNHPNTDWDRLFANGADLYDYFGKVVDSAGLRERITFGTEVAAADFGDGEWTVETTDGRRFTADVVVAATGVLHHPYTPDISGSANFEGLLTHSARWDPNTTLAGKRIGVIGAGSTAVQIVSAVARAGGSATMFARKPQWVVKIPDPTIPDAFKVALRHVPGLQGLVYKALMVGMDVATVATLRDGIQRRMVNGFAERSLEKIVDPALRDVLTPDDEPLCKRLIVSPSFHDAVQSDAVTVVDAGIDHITSNGIVAADGVHHELDAIIMATGFKTQNYMRPMTVRGRAGHTLADAWRDGPRAFKTTMIPGLPNFFLLMGPNSPIGNASLVPIAEAQARFVGDWLSRMRDQGYTEVEPTPQATQRFYDDVGAHMPDTIWTSGCDSWYLGPDGTPMLWPKTLRTFILELAKIDPADYVTRRTRSVTDDRPLAAPALEPQ